MIDYLRDPAAISRRSFALIRDEVDGAALPDDIAPAAYRAVHACGMPDIVEDLAWSEGAGRITREALRRGAPILTDVVMLASGISTARLPAANRIICMLNDPSVPALAERFETTRTAAAVELWRPYLAGAVCAIGNAPTALFRLLEMVQEGSDKPAVVIAAPPGFVGAVESKAALAEPLRGLAFITLHGRRGGSAITAAIVNALASEAA